MTGYCDDSDPNSSKKVNSDEKEKNRLESILKDAEQTWKRGLDQRDVDESMLVGGKRKRPDKDDAEDNDEGMLSLLSPELREQFAGMESLAILPSGAKKKNKKKELPPLTPAEIKAAKSLYKNTQRKLAQLEQRRKQKELRSGLYKELEANTLLAPTGGNISEDGKNQSVAVSNNITPQEAQSLLLKSSELGKKLSKKQKLKQLRQKEALGLKLSKEEMDLLYVKYEAPAEDSFPVSNGADNNDGTSIEKAEDASGSKRKKSKKKKRKSDAVDDKNEVADGDAQGTKAERAEAAQKETKMDSDLIKENENDTIVGSSNTKTSAGTEMATDTAHLPEPETKQSATSYAQMMLAGLSTLKTKTDSRNIELADEKARNQQREEEEAMRLEEEERKRRKVYVPSETIKVSTMHRIDVPVDISSGDSRNHRVQIVNRPADVEESRYDLPVSAMEFEIIDAVRSNDCTILCGGEYIH
jgi:hypothetical protein